jgi:hypothetical protein
MPAPIELRSKLVRERACPDLSGSNHEPRTPPLHLPQLIQFTGFPCFKQISSKARKYCNYLISSYFFLDEKVSKKSRLKRLKGYTLARR